MHESLRRNINEKVTFWNAEFGKVHDYNHGVDRDNVSLSVGYALNKNSKKNNIAILTLIDRNDGSHLSYTFEKGGDLLIFSDALRQIYKQVMKIYDDEPISTEDKKEIL